MFFVSIGVVVVEVLSWLTVQSSVLVVSSELIKQTFFNIQYATADQRKTAAENPSPPRLIFMTVNINQIHMPFIITIFLILESENRCFVRQRIVGINK
jgi:hypothetical protein